MGTLLSCDQCTAAGTDTVITFSEDVIKRIIDGNSDVVNDEHVLPDKDWFEKLKCIDDSHSVAYGLTLDAFNALVLNIEHKLHGINVKCENENIVSCMKENTECPLKCSEEVYKYIDCCDARRLNLIKQRMNEEARKREAEKKKAIKEKQKQKQK